MTRRSVYFVGLIAFTAATVMVLLSINLPDWISLTGGKYGKHIGLHLTCSNLSEPPCRTFPDEELCQGDERSFCSMWRTIGFLASFSIIVHLAGVVAFVVVMAGGKYQREIGWPIVSGLLVLASVVEYAIIGVVAYLYDNDEQFMVPGWKLDRSWYLCAVSATFSMLSAAGLASSVYLLPPEDGYDFLEDPGSP